MAKRIIFRLELNYDFDQLVKYIQEEDFYADLTDAEVHRRAVDLAKDWAEGDILELLDVSYGIEDAEEE